MNILVITQLYPEPDDAGGYKITHTVEYFCKEWAASGHKVVVFHVPSKFPAAYYSVPSFLKRRLVKGTLRIIPRKESREEIHYCSADGINVYRLPILKLLPGGGYSRAKLKNVSKRIVSVLTGSSFKPDIVMGHFANPSTELVSRIASFYKCKSSIVFHNDCNKRSVRKYRLLENIKTIKAVGCRSQAESRLIGPMLNRDLFICYSGVPNDAILTVKKICNKHNYENGVKYLYVGGLVSAKNVDSVIKAFALSKKEKDTLTIVGDGDEKEKLISLVHSLELENQVFFLGRKNREKVLSIMQESHVFAMVSKHETFGMVYMEAMLQGCLTIASIDGGFDGIIKDGENGFLCKQGDATMLASIFERISNLSVKERNEIAENAIKLGLQYSEKDVADRYLNEVLKRNEGNQNA